MEKTTKTSYEASAFTKATTTSTTARKFKYLRKRKIALPSKSKTPTSAQIKFLFTSYLRRNSEK
jgi:hypothetical protein